MENLIQGKVNYEKRLIISYDKFYLGSEYENGTEINAEVEGIDYDQNKNRFIILVNKKGGANDSLFTFDASLLK